MVFSGIGGAASWSSAPRDATQPSECRDCQESPETPHSAVIVSHKGGSVNVEAAASPGEGPPSPTFGFADVPEEFSISTPGDDDLVASLGTLPQGRHFDWAPATSHLREGDANTERCQENDCASSVLDADDASSTAAPTEDTDPRLREKLAEVIQRQEEEITRLHSELESLKVSEAPGSLNQRDPQEDFATAIANAPKVIGGSRERAAGLMAAREQLKQKLMAQISALSWPEDDDRPMDPMFEPRAAPPVSAPSATSSARGSRKGLAAIASLAVSAGTSSQKSLGMARPPPQTQLKTPRGQTSRMTLSTSGREIGIRRGPAASGSAGSKASGIPPTGRQPTPNRQLVGGQSPQRSAASRATPTTNAAPKAVAKGRAGISSPQTPRRDGPQQSDSCKNQASALRRSESAERGRFKFTARSVSPPSDRPLVASPSRPVVHGGAPVSPRPGGARASSRSPSPNGSASRPPSNPRSQTTRGPSIITSAAGGKMPSANSNAAGRGRLPSSPSRGGTGTSFKFTARSVSPVIPDATQAPRSPGGRGASPGIGGSRVSPTRCVPPSLPLQLQACKLPAGSSESALTLPRNSGAGPLLARQVAALAASATTIEGAASWSPRRGTIHATGSGSSTPRGQGHPPFSVLNRATAIVDDIVSRGGSLEVSARGSSIEVGAAKGVVYTGSPRVMAQQPWLKNRPSQQLPQGYRSAAATPGPANGADWAFANRPYQA